jgi:beta-fructofuranosidase
VPRISGEFVRVYIPGGDVFTGPDSPSFKAGQFYPEWVPNDFAIIKGVDGCWHAIGITHPKPPPDAKNVHEAEWQFFHAVSPVGKLKEHLQAGAWHDAEKVLTPAERVGEIKECYAPFIFSDAGIFRIIYGPTALRMAVSTNLFDWVPVGTLFTSDNGARDPGLIKFNGQYILYFTTKNTVMARTSTDLRHWSANNVEIFKMRRGVAPESPTIVEHGGQFYLFWCIWDSRDIVNGSYDNRTFVFRSSTPLDFHQAPCVAELHAHAPEIFQDEDGDWFIASVEWPQRGLSIARLMWEQDLR